MKQSIAEKQRKTVGAYRAARNPPVIIGASGECEFRDRARGTSSVIDRKEDGSVTILSLLQLTLFTAKHRAFSSRSARALPSTYCVILRAHDWLTNGRTTPTGQWCHRHRARSRRIRTHGSLLFLLLLFLSSFREEKRAHDAFSHDASSALHSVPLDVGRDTNDGRTHTRARARSACPRRAHTRNLFLSLLVFLSLSLSFPSSPSWCFSRNGRICGRGFAAGYALVRANISRAATGCFGVRRTKTIISWFSDAVMQRRRRGRERCGARERKREIGPVIGNRMRTFFAIQICTINFMQVSSIIFLEFLLLLLRIYLQSLLNFSNVVGLCPVNSEMHIFS